MKTTVMLVTPAMAREWLDHNTNNRRLRAGVVDNFLRLHERGEWKLTHQGIAFDRFGTLVDGQHRLTFISLLADGESVPLNVTTDICDDAFDAIDIGLKRTMSDIYKISPDLAAVGRFFAKMWNSNSSAGLTNHYVKPFADWAQPEHRALTAFCPRNAKIWSSATVKSAAIYQMKRGHDHDFVLMAYHSMVVADVEAMPFACRALMNQYISGKIVSSKSIDLFCRAVRAFDSRQTGRVKSILVKDVGTVTDEVREFIGGQMKKSPALAGLKVAKPSSKSTALMVA